MGAGGAGLREPEDVLDAGEFGDDGPVVERHPGRPALFLGAHR